MTDPKDEVISNATKMSKAVRGIKPHDMSNACVMLLMFSYDQGIDSKKMSFAEFAVEVNQNMLQNRKIQEGGKEGYYGFGLKEGCTPFKH